ncbi:MAG TPA: hypothetical protein PK357_00670 [Candidatus Pacearchaeota archaeon]|nr:hypothetical protein [Candidatus Pacearchaeota archaeon]
MIYQTLFLLALLLTVAVEVCAVLFLSSFLIKKTKISKIVFASVLASVLTLPYLWFVFPVYTASKYYVVFGEIGVFLIESFIYYRLLEIKLWKASVLSFASNALSILVGLIAF